MKGGIYMKINKGLVSSPFNERSVNMKTLVIHPDDSTTDFLSDIYSDKDWEVIRAPVDRDELDAKIAAHDRIVMLGHGVPSGLIGHSGLVIDEAMAPLLRGRECVCIWCNADQYVLRHGLSGFYTGMFVSEPAEARLFGLPMDEDPIKDSNRLFAEVVRESVFKENMLELTKQAYISSNNPVIDYNRDRLYTKDALIEDLQELDGDGDREYEIDPVDNHVIVRAGGKRLLIDTGSPFSFGDGGYLTILGEKRSFQQEFMGLNAGKLGGMIGTRIDMLLGNDVLRSLNFYIDWRSRKIRFSGRPFKENGVTLPLTFVMGVPMVEVGVNGGILNVLLDTGAKLSYLDPELTSGLRNLGDILDFYPGFCQFTTGSFAVPVTMAGLKMNLMVGRLPPSIQLAVNAMGARGIVGTEIFNHYNACFNLPQSELVLVDRGGF
jgi:hypothetical protein